MHSLACCRSPCASWGCSECQFGHATVMFLSQEFFRCKHKGKRRRFFFFKLHHFLFPWCLNSKHTQAITTSGAHKPPPVAAVAKSDSDRHRANDDGRLFCSGCHCLPGGRFVAILLFSCRKPHLSVSLSFNNLEAVTEWIYTDCIKCA